MELLKTTLRADGGVRSDQSRSEDRWTLRLAPEPGQEPVLKEVSARFHFNVQDADVVWVNGYQSWTHSPERRTDGLDKSLLFCPGFLDRKFGFSQYGDGHFCKPQYRRGLFKGYSYAYIRRGKTYHFFGSLSEDTGFTRIVINAKEGTVSFEKDCRGRALSSEWTGLDLYLAKGTEDEVFDGWFAAMGVQALPAKPAVGYTSWYNCYQDISELQILRDLKGMKTLRPQPEIFQIDDGYERFVGDWLDVDEKKFPQGLEPILRQITAAGYRAGIWLAPFLCEKKSALFREHPDWLLRDEAGEPVYTGGNWSGGYALDVYNDEVRSYVRRSIEHYKNMGFTLFKLDFLYAACMLPRPDKTRGEIMAEAMDFLREVCGQAQILGCGVPLASAFGRVEYCRVGPDISLDYDDKPYMRLFHAERPSTLQTLHNTVFRRQLDGRAFLNDPDVFILRHENNTLTPAQKEALGSLNALFGSVLFASDNFESYDEAQRKLFARFCDLQAARHVTLLSAAVFGKTTKLKIRYELRGETKLLECEI